MGKIDFELYKKLKKKPESKNWKQFNFINESQVRVKYRRQTEN